MSDMTPAERRILQRNITRLMDRRCTMTARGWPWFQIGNVLDAVSCALSREGYGKESDAVWRMADTVRMRPETNADARAQRIKDMRLFRERFADFTFPIAQERYPRLTGLV